MKKSLFFLPALLVCLTVPLVSGTPNEETALFDHHTHILSPDLIRDWKSLGVPFSRPDEFYSSLPKDVSEGRVKKAFALSMAYLYGSEWFGALKFSPEKELEAVRRENDFVAGIVKSNPKKLVGFCSANPAKDYALNEFKRCTAKPEMEGVKLHLLNSMVSVGSEEHMARLRALFAWAEKERVPMMIHLNAYDPAGPSEMANAFAKELAGYPDLEVYIAHLGGSGGYSDRGRKILRAFVERLKKDEAFAAMDLRFEISAVVLTEVSEEVEPPTDDQLKLLAEDLSELGLERIVFGTDHPSFSADAYRKTLREKLPLKEAEIEKILANRGRAMK
ncbi:MAG: amidohydrolase family protein [Acidobacteriota bacterium]|nr:MAG: amidohydrolase family protein [Acidobacteriota bacterium]